MNGFDPRHRLMTYILAKRYGARYLDEAEFRKCVSKAERDYYEFLASHVSVKRNSGFWKYHDRGLDLASERIDWSRVVRMQFPRLINCLGNPKAALGTLARHLLSLSRAGNPIPPRPSNY